MDKIAIIGGGIGGLALANCFKNQGIPFDLFESAEAFGEAGAGIGISESTIEILNKLGLKEAIIKDGRFVRNTVIVNKQKRVIRKLPIENAGFCLHRSSLLSVLATNISSDNVSFNRRVVDIEINGESAVLKFSTGIWEAYSTVIACDGINSSIRKRFLPHVQQRFSGQTVWRGIANVNLPEDFKEAYYEFWGENKRFATIPLNDKQYYWYAVKRAAAGGKDNPVTVKEDLRNLFKNYKAEVHSVIDNTESIIRNDMWDLRPSNSAWHYNNVIFLGDAIHATTPNLAQGACQAIEDAYALAMIIKKYGANENAAKLYRDIRLNKVKYVVDQSWRYGNVSHSSTSLKEVFTTWFFKLMPNSFFQKQYHKLIDLDYLEKI